MTSFRAITEIVCPCCFEKIALRDVMFVDTKDLANRDYSPLTNSRKLYFHENISLSNYPLIFPKSDNSDDPFSAVTSTGNITHIRACPQCYNYLPGSAGHFPTVIIPVIGPNRAQKSAYLSVLLHNICNRLSADFGATLIPADYETAYKFYTEYERPLYIDKQIPDPAESVRALTYKFSRNNTNEPQTQTDRNGGFLYNQALIMFYDIDFQSFDKYPEYYAKVMSNASGIILLMDSPRDEAITNGEFVTEPIYGLLAEKVTELFGGRVSKFSAIVMSELDKCGEKTRKSWRKINDKVRRIKRVEKKYPFKAFDSVNRSVRRLMKKDFVSSMNVINSLFDQKITQIFAYHSCTDETGGVLAEKIPETAAEIPLLYLLSQMNLIPYGRGKIIKTDASGREMTASNLIERISGKISMLTASTNDKK